MIFLFYVLLLYNGARFLRIRLMHLLDIFSVIQLFNHFNERPLNYSILVSLTAPIATQRP